MASEIQAETLRKFGQHFLNIRKRKKLSYRKIALKCDLDYSDISKIEKGERNISLTTLIELAKGLEVDIKELVDFKI